ncbi:hypothetical protein L6164_020260 [Bauhinia variegata]|uniref:Uncharacterized protein n=1 Tax=Bauhinia variegata TaxID=167791 RepID=A0ACB9MWH8_BAUVA|nr:hypothetical protein L6164_020260 [Bauhinia variegata]
MSTVNKKHDERWMHDNNGLSGEDYILDGKFAGEESLKDNAAFDALSSSRGNKFIKHGTDVINKSSEGGSLCYSHELCNNLKINGNIQMPFLKSCSRQGSVLHEKVLFVNDENDVLSDSFMSKQNLGVDCGSAEDLLSHTHPEVIKKFNMSRDSDIISRAFVAENLFLSDSCYSKTGGSGSGHQLLDSEWYSVYPEPLSLATPWAVDHISDNNDIKRMPRYHKMDSYMNLLDDEENECKFSYKRSRISSQYHCSSSFANVGFDFGCPADPSKISYGFDDQPDCSDIYFTKWSDILTNESDWLCLESDREKFQRLGKNRGRRDHFGHSAFEKKSARRSFSAPPFSRRKRRFVSSNQPSEFIARTPAGQTYNHVLNCEEAYDFKHPKQSSGALQLSTEEQLLPKIIPNVKKRPEIVADTEVNTIREFDNFQNFNIQSSTPFEDSIDYSAKWRNCSAKLPENDNMPDTQTQSNILDISSGFLHLAGDSLIPESICKNSLEDAKVLHQVDKKFIPIVAGRTLAIIDQHAADERIRLEELRQKVLSGEAKTITYLDAEKELVLPEIGYQLLHNYAEQVKDWGWICNIHTQDSKSFKRNLDILNRQPMVVMLIAVPCILGVKLSDVDLMEFLQQLADTEGSSTMPPSVIRVLNMKACRGAIMFGDSLLPSECSLLVEELKHTSLCFQCAHGRPTTAPLVNLEALYSQIAKFGLTNDCSNDEWHGLRRHKVCVERAAQRLYSASAEAEC